MAERDIFSRPLSEIWAWYQQAAPASQVRVWARLLHLALESNEGLIAKNLLVEQGLLDISETLTEKAQSCRPDTGILILRYFVSVDNIERARTFYISLQDKGLARKRMLDIVVQKLISAELWEEAKSLYLRYIACYKPTDSDLILFSTAPASVRADVFMTALGQRLTLKTKGPGPGQGQIPGQDYVITRPDKAGQLKIGDHIYKLQKLRPDSVEKGALWDFFVTGLKTVPPGLSEKYRYIVDGANVLFYGTEYINPHSYRRLDLLITQLKARKDGDVLVVLHERHRPSLSSDRDAVYFWKRWRDIICVSSRYDNDDLYSLAMAIDNEALLVTNDKFRDHVFKAKAKGEAIQGTFAHWRAENVIEYADDESYAPIMRWPLAWSRRIQSDESYVYVPYEYEQGQESDAGLWAAVPRTRVRG